MTPDCPLDATRLSVDDTPLRDNRFGLDRSIRIGWCPSCGLGVTIDPPSQAELDHLYSTCYAADGGPAQRPGSSRAARAWHRINGSLPVVDAPLDGPVLDVGCNTGGVLLVLRERGLDVTGLEPNPQAAAVARAQGLEVIEQPIESADLPRERFRSVVLSQVIEHVQDPHAVLRHVRSSVAPGGRIFLVVPNADSIWRHVFGVGWVHWHVPFHLWHHTRRSLALLLEQSGFRLERTRTVTPGEWLLMSIEARRNARVSRFELEPFRGRFGRRLAVAPAGRIGDALGRGDALYVVASVAY